MSLATADLATFCDAVPHPVIVLDADQGQDFANRRWRDHTGVAVSHERDWIDLIHGDDRHLFDPFADRAAPHDETFRAECRLRGRDGDFSWFLAQAGALREPEGLTIRWLLTFTNIEIVKRSEQVYMVLAHELGHRVKNIFAIFSGLVRLSVPKHPSAADFAAELDGRVGALAAANELAVPGANAGISTTALALIEQLLAPYRTLDRDRIRLDLDDLPLGLSGANALALIVHEQATNAVKYGSLSTASGTLVVKGRRRDDHYVVTWAECGGPRLDDAPKHKGFGSRLTDRTVSRQLGGRVERRWLAEGLSMEMHFSIERLQS
ncbi:sensor histidine kinase [Caulobacter sp. S45]|uniref:sensor histidine kinase n=1 Tax=Caulobacter sp. S45 TaxID=1641861 RepID=UPI00131EC20F|nr:HWE histidine kinase domain-containing protein [Caulobacter sp. S45]